jgi:hypothetical protein
MLPKVHSFANILALSKALWANTNLLTYELHCIFSAPFTRRVRKSLEKYPDYHAMTVDDTIKESYVNTFGGFFRLLFLLASDVDGNFERSNGIFSVA